MMMMMMIVEQSVECKLAREIEVLRKPASVPLVHHKSHMT
jgi:hypothetical protein